MRIHFDLVGQKTSPICGAPLKGLRLLPEMSILLAPGPFTSTNAVLITYWHHYNGWNVWHYLARGFYARATAKELPLENPLKAWPPFHEIGAMESNVISSPVDIRQCSP